MARLLKKSVAQQVAEQREWIEEHGRSLSGYIERYGSVDDPKHYGDGGEAIYEADVSALRRLEERLR
jgi:hypothetical protein